MEDAPQLMALRSQAGAAMVAAPASAQVPAGLSTTRQADGLFYLTAQVNGKPVRFIVDTGASLVVLSKDDAARTGVQRGEVISATTANGATAMQRATIEQFDLAGRQLRDVRAIVAGQGDVSLIGQNVLAQMDRVVIEGTTLQLR
jgi:aspartyl protease family protein